MRVVTAVVAFGALVATLLASHASRAEEPEETRDRPATETPRVELRHSWVADSVATGVLAAGLVTWTAARSSHTTLTCTLCDGADADGVNGFDNAFRQAFARRDGTAAETASKVIAYGVAPAATVALTLGVAAADHRLDEAPLDALLVAEGTLAGMAANETLGAIVLRERPGVHALDAATKAGVISQADSLRSFPSGFTGSVMAMTASAGTVAMLRRYRLAPLIWIVGSTLALTTSYLRIAADRSYATDEITGVAAGFLFGAGIPLLFHRRVQHPNAVTALLSRATVTSSAVPGGRLAGLSWGF